MRLIAIIQARLGSTRLPGKVLMPIAGQSVLAHVVNRVRRSGAFEEVVLATTHRIIDDPLTEAAAALGVAVVRGSEDDVLSRFVGAVDAIGADAIARITADCPLIDPEVLSAMAARFRAERCDYLSNSLVRTYPRGLDAEFLTVAALREAAAEGHRPHHREHVTPWIYEHRQRYTIVDFIDSADRSGWRWTLDTPEDFQLITRLIDTAGDVEATYPQLASIYAAHPEWHSINAHIEQKRVAS